MKMRRLILAFGLILLVVAGAVAAQTSSGGFIGIRLQNGDDGVVILEVLAGSPAAEAGLQVDDVITAVNGDAVTRATEVAAVAQAAASGDSLTLTITRADESLDVDVVLGTAPEATPEAGNGGRRGNGNGNRGGDTPFQMLDTGITYNAENGTWEVQSLSEGAPLYAAGLREGDVITAVNGESVDIMGLFDLISGSNTDATITLTVERDGAEQSIDVPVAAILEFGMMGMRQDMGGGRLGLGGSMMQGGYGRLGVTFVTLDEQTAADNDVDFVEGALITDVADDSPAAMAAVTVGDIVTSVNGEPVDQERTLRDRISAYEPGDVVTLTVLRAGESSDIEVTLGEQVDHMFMLPGMGMRGFRFNDGPADATPAPEMTPEATAVPNT